MAEQKDPAKTLDAGWSTRVSDSKLFVEFSLQQDPIDFSKTLGESKARSVLPSIEIELATTLGESKQKAIIPSERLTSLVNPELTPRYVLQKLLGEGAMGEVLLARDLDIGRDVALKRILSNTKDPVFMARFIDEIRLMGKLEHPNIAPIYDVGLDENDQVFFVMRFVNGKTLDSIIKLLRAGDLATHNAFPFMRRLEIFVGILHALEFAHAKGILHRDIKPENVMVGEHGEVAVMDWGIARGIETENQSGEDNENSSPNTDRFAKTQVGGIVGTPLYMSPEQATGHSTDLDARSDLYSSFVLLFEFLTLERLIQDVNSVVDVVMKITRDPVPELDLEAWNHPEQPGIPFTLRHFIRRGLRKDKELRFQNATEVIKEVEFIFSGHVRVECSATFLKRAEAEFNDYIALHPKKGMVIIFSVPTFILSLIIAVIILAI